MKAAFALLLVPAFAYADGAVSFEVQDHGDSVEVIAHNVEAKNLNVNPVRSRLEIQVNGTPIANRLSANGDTTVMFAEFDSHAFSVKTHFSYDETKNLAKSAKATQVGSDLHLSFPRKIVAVAAEAPKAEPVKAEAPKAEAPKVEAPKAIPADPKPSVLDAPVKKESPQEAIAKIEQKPAAAPAAAPAPAQTHPLLPDHEKSFGNNGMYAVGGLVLLGLAYFFRKKKKKPPWCRHRFDVVAQRALGNKAKVMWLSAGGREMLVAVTQQQVRMLGSWGKDDRNPLPRAATLGSFREELANPPQVAEPIDNEEPAPQVHSSAVSGLLKLRARTSTGMSMGRASTNHNIEPLPMVNEDVATDDAAADLEWAKEIMTATGGARR
ncbi:MAG: flagellar biosynthetic protein FliO [Kofleriaceae bacterium]